jgi:uncharacterized membrane protein
MVGLTAFGAFHTLISLLAVAAGIAAFVKYKQIAYGTPAGKAFILLTVASCVTGLFIFHHGGFGKPHALALITLVTLGAAFAAETRSTFGHLSRYVATLGYSLSFFFHIIPGFTETSTRLPAGHPLVASPDAPGLQAAISGAFVVFLIGAFLQLRRLRASAGPAPLRHP